MSLLLDENLSPRLVQRLASLFPGLSHVRDFGLQQTDDREIWRWARENGRTVITADSDFVEMVARTGPPPKLIHIARCDFPFRIVEELLRQNAIRISEFQINAEADILTLHLPPIRRK